MEVDDEEVDDDVRRVARSYRTLTAGIYGLRAREGKEGGTA
jgi:hypothetical protein